MGPSGNYSATEWKPLVVCPHADLARAIRTVLGTMDMADVALISAYPRPEAVAGLAAQHASNICFLDLASNAEHGLALISELAGNVPVVALNTANDADLILRCLRRGACEFLVDPTAQQVREVLDRLARLRAPGEQRRLGTVYCVLPGKVGSGASTVAVHLAIELKRRGAASVLLADTDCLTGSVAFLLKLKTDFSVSDAVRDWNRLDGDLWGRLITPSHGVDVLPAPEAPARLEMEHSVAVELLSFWREHYEAVVLDTAGIQSAAALDLVKFAEETLLVTTNELAALHATRRGVELLEEQGADRQRLKLLVNRYTPSAGLNRDDVQTALKLKPYALLTNDYDAIQDALLEGHPAAAASRFGRSIASLAEALTGKPVPVRKRSSLLGILPGMR